jgi:ubiquinone/menaquinone biosynthesis C-methylase UbiE
MQGQDLSKNAYAEKITLLDPLREPLFRSLIHSLKLTEGSRGLDIGCGIGSNTLILADAVGESGHATGLDLSEELLAYAAQRAQEAGFSQRVSFLKCDMNRLAFSDNALDWVWSADCAGYAPGDAASLIKHFAGLVKPGGSVFVIARKSLKVIEKLPQNHKFSGNSNIF